MPFADANRTGVSFAEETRDSPEDGFPLDWGVDPVLISDAGGVSYPGAQPSLIDTRFTGAPLEYEKQTVESDEINPDRNVVDLIEVGANAQGSTGFELSYAGMDSFIKAGLHATDNDWGTPGAFTGAGGAGDIQFTATGNLLDAATASFIVTLGLKPGMIIYIKDGAGTTLNAANAGYFKIVAVNSATQLEIAGIAKSWTTLVDQDSMDSVLSASNARNGTSEWSYVIEERFEDIGVFIVHTGMEVGQLDLSFASRSIVTGGLTWRGRDSAALTATVDAGGGYTAAATNAVMNATSNVGVVRAGSTELDCKIKQLNLSVANQLRGRDAVGCRTDVSIGRGECQVTGEIQAYFEDKTLWDQARTHASTSLLWQVTDAAGNSYVFDIPTLKWGSPRNPIPGKNNDVMLTLPFQGIKTTAADGELYTMQVSKFAA